MAQFADALTLDASQTRMTRDGYMGVHARAARSGIYDYLGREVDPTGKHFAADQRVRVYRPESEVFDKASVASFIAKPITDNHPAESVTADNWRQHARGAVMGALKDGEHLAFDLVLMDKALIEAVKAGKRELSNGYTCDLAFESGTTPDGKAYDAIQRNIRGNHVAVVDRGRAGSACRIGDAPVSGGAGANAPAFNADGGNAFAACDANPAAIANLADKGLSPMPKITLDGLLVDLADADAVQAAFAKKDAAIADAVKALADAKVAHDKAIAAKDAEIDALKAKVMDAAAIDALVDAKAAVAAKAKALLGDKAPDLKGLSVADARRKIVAAKLGDAAVAGKSDDYVEARFDHLDAEPVKSNVTPLVPVAATDAATVAERIRASRY